MEPPNTHYFGLPKPSPKYFVLTSVLSNIADAASTTISSLSNHPRSKSRSPWCAHIYRSAVSSDGRLAAFLTDTGQLKIAALVSPSSNNNGSRLQPRNIPITGFQAKKESEVQHTGRIGIRTDASGGGGGGGGGGFVITMVDRYGTVIETRITESQQSRQRARYANANAMLDSMSRSSMDKTAAAIQRKIAVVASELPHAIEPVHELAAPTW